MEATQHSTLPSLLLHKSMTICPPAPPSPPNEAGMDDSDVAESEDVAITTTSCQRSGCAARGTWAAGACGLGERVKDVDRLCSTGTIAGGARSGGGAAAGGGGGGTGEGATAAGGGGRDEAKEGGRVADGGGAWEDGCAVASTGGALWTCKVVGVGDGERERWDGEASRTRGAVGRE